MGSELPLETVPGGVRLRVRLTPRAASDRIEGIVADGEGRPALKVAVRAVPEDGKANKALIALLAKSWKLPKSRFTIASGATDRNKILFFEGEAERLARPLTELSRSS